MFVSHGDLVEQEIREALTDKMSSVHVDCVMKMVSNMREFDYPRIVDDNRCSCGE